MNDFIVHPHSLKRSSVHDGYDTKRFQRSTVVDIPTPGAGFVPACQTSIRSHLLQMLFFNAETQNAFTIFLAGAAFTLISLPKATLVPAFLAGFILVLIMQRPGMVNLPAFFTSAVASAANSPSTFVHSDFLRPVLVAKASAMPVFDMDTALAFITFMAFTIAEEDQRGKTMETARQLSCSILSPH